MATLRYNTDGKARRGDLYPLGEPPAGYKGQFPIPKDTPVGIAALLTDEFRRPKKGEWYLRHQHCYRAEVDLMQPFFIAELVFARHIPACYEISRFAGPDGA